MAAAPIGPAEPDGGIVHRTHYGRRVAMIVPTDGAGTEAPLSPR